MARRKRNTDPAYNAGNQADVQAAKHGAKFARETELSELKYILSTKGGRKFLWRLLEQCGIYQSSFTGNSETFFLEGKRKVGLWTLGEIMAADPEAYQLMQSEAKEIENG